MKRITIYIIFGLLAAILLLSGCGQPKIRVASKQDIEGAILAQLIIQYLRDKGYEVIYHTWMYSTDTLREVLADGDIDIYPEYTGNGCLWFNELCDGESFIKSDNLAEMSDILNEKEAQNNTGLKWLMPAEAENNWAVVVNNEVARVNAKMSNIRKQTV